MLAAYLERFFIPTLVRVMNQGLPLESLLDFVIRGGT